MTTKLTMLPTSGATRAAKGADPGRHGLARDVLPERARPMRSLRILALSVLAAACSTPSVPLPPPAVDVSALRFAGGTPGSVVLRGEPRELHAGARFYIIDTATGDGVITTAATDGSFTAPPLAAQSGDTAEIAYQQPDGDRSTLTCVTVLVDQPLVGATCQ